MIEITKLWMVQRMVAGLLYMFAGAAVISAVTMTLLNAFTFFHVVPTVLFIWGCVKLAQYPFQPVPNLKEVA